jgi:hypothetical protein
VLVPWPLLSGECQLGNLDIPGRRLKRGCMREAHHAVPRDLGHYAENTGQEPLVFLELLRSEHYANVSLAQWIGVLPPEPVKADLNIDDETIARLPKPKRLVVR